MPDLWICSCIACTQLQVPFNPTVESERNTKTWRDLYLRCYHPFSFAMTVLPVHDLLISTLKFLFESDAAMHRRIANRNSELQAESDALDPSPTCTLRVAGLEQKAAGRRLEAATWSEPATARISGLPKPAGHLLAWAHHGRFAQTLDSRLPESQR